MSRPAVLALFASGLAACSAAPAATNDTDASSESAASADEEDGSGEDEAGADEVGEDEAGEDEAGEDEAGGTTDDVSTGGGSDLPGLPDPSAIQGLLDAALPEAPEGVDGITLVVHDETDERVLELTAGELTTDVRFPVASASKYVSALVFLRLVDEGLLSSKTRLEACSGTTGRSRR